MTRQCRLVALSGAIVASLALPAASQALTKQVYEGLPTTAQKKFIDPKYNTDAIDFFPHSATIHVGDSIKFSATAFHNVDIPAKGKDPVTLLGPVGTTVTGSNDAAGNPYWFNGLPNFGFNPDLINGTPPVNYDPFKTAKGKGTSFTYTGKKGVATPIPFGDHPEAADGEVLQGRDRQVLLRPAPPGMEGVIHVRAKSKTIPSAKADAKTLKAQIDRDFKIAKTLKDQPPPANTIDVGNAGKYGVEYFSFLPGKTTVPVGTTIKFQITPLSYESHTATTGPGGPIDNPTSYLGIIAASFFSKQFVPAGHLPERPVRDGRHADAAVARQRVLELRRAGQRQVLATADEQLGDLHGAGTYEFYCMVHPQMHGTVIVQ